MSKEKQTFIDPKTGEQIESTWLARFMGNFIPVELFCLINCVIINFFVQLPFWHSVSLAVIASTILSSLTGLVGIRLERFYLVLYGVHDEIAGRQYSNQQRLLKRRLLEEEWANVPNRALSRANPNGPPQPTEVALSRSDDQTTEDGGQIRLTGEETTADDGQTVKSQR